MGDSVKKAKEEGRLRAKIGQMLANGLKTKVEPVPQNSNEFNAIVADLRKISEDSPEKTLEKKLVLGGFLAHPYGEDNNRCQECMYYLIHRKWCDLPELSLPVEAEWYCRLWRI
jgi:hypothetical protein